MFQTPDDIYNDLTAAGIDDATARLLAQHARPAVWLETRAVDDESAIPIGATKLGGRPDLPAGVAWPVRPPWHDAAERIRRLHQDIADMDKAKARRELPFPPERYEANRQRTQDEIRRHENAQPLSFIAQFNFAELWQAGPLDADMPRQGVLSVFYDVIDQPWGHAPQHRIGFAVLYHDSHDNAGPLARRDTPAPLQALADEYGLAPLACDLHACMTPLSPQTAHYARLELADALSRQIRENWEWSDSGPQATEEGEDWCCHHVGGWPTPVQSDMQMECALVSAGHDCGDSKAFHQRALAAIHATATDWLLLAQIGTDEKADLCWGDGGQLYLWIRRDDLKARRFDKAWLCLQCT